MPHLKGFQAPCLGQTCSYDIVRGPLCRIYTMDINTSWLLISTGLEPNRVGAKPGEVHIFDSMYTSIGTAVKEQISALLCSHGVSITLKLLSAQKQSGGSDCGLFAIAFATVIGFGYVPGQFFFDQTKMWRHLLTCRGPRKGNVDVPLAKGEEKAREGHCHQYFSPIELIFLAT